jgi:hypothetical protein
MRDLDCLSGLIARLEAVVPAMEQLARLVRPAPTPRDVVVAPPARFVKERPLDDWIAERVMLDDQAVTATRVLFEDYSRSVAVPGASSAPQRRFARRLLELPGVRRVEGRSSLRGIRLRRDGDGAAAK